MPQRTRNFFAKLIHSFEWYFDTPRLASSSSSVDIVSTGPAPTQIQSQLPALSPPGPSGPPPHTTYPAISFTPSISQVAAPSAPMTTSLQPPSHSVHDDGMVSSYLTASSPGYGPTPASPQPVVSRTPMLQSSEPVRFSGAHDFIIKDSQLIDISLTSSGIDKLFKNSMPDAFHNSAARYPPPKCHLGTREEYIAKITDWALGISDHKEPILWLRGPFGVGKSAVAQSCAEALQHQRKLAATLFFSRSNADRDDPRRVFTSIAYQIATLCEPFSNIVDARIRKDPALATKSLSTQFEELLVRPLSQIDSVRSGFEGCTIIIDGLDECREPPEQCDIIDIIAASVHTRTTPFRWFITSRPEELIIQTMNSDTVSPVSFHLELPVSWDIDHEILVYLVDEFEKIRKRYRLPASWPSEQALNLLVVRTAGLWIYATTIMRFVADEQSLGPQDQLRIVLEFAKDISSKGGPDNPLAEMDFFYTLIMQRVPEKIRTLVRKILLLRGWFYPYQIASILGLSEEQLWHSCTFIQSVVELQGWGLRLTHFRFYHVSFLDFMEDPTRSKELCIYGDLLIQFRRERLDWVHQVCSRSTGRSDIIFPSDPVLPEGMDLIDYYSINLVCFWLLSCVPNHPFDLQAAVSLSQLRFRMMLQLTNGAESIYSKQFLDFIDNLPTELRGKIIRNDKCPTPGCTNANNVWIFGHGENEAVAKCDSYGDCRLENNRDLDPGRCFCGSLIETDNRAVHAELCQSRG